MKRTVLAAVLIIQGVPSRADTLSPCGWRGTRILRCYEDTNGDQIRQEHERYWSGGVEEMEKSQSVSHPSINRPSTDQSTINQGSSKQE